MRKARPTTRKAGDTKAHDAILAELKSDDPARVAAAVAGIEKEARKHIKQTQFLQVIVEAKRYPEAESAARDLILAQPGAVLSVDGLQKCLATTLLAEASLLQRSYTPNHQTLPDYVSLVRAASR